MNKVYGLLAGFALTALSAIWNEPLRAETLPHDFRFVYVERESDPFYDPPPETDGVIRVQNTPPYAGAQLGIKDVQALGRAANATFTLERDTVAAEADIAAEIKKVAASGAAIILLDLPHDDIIAAAQAVPADAIALFNIRDMHDDLRQDLCNTALFHTIPSQTALSDALAQFIVRKNWKRVLTLKGPEAEDEALAGNFAISAKKFGAKIIDTKPFIAGNDPRKREQISTALMTGDSDYDVIYLADSTGDFGRFVPYRQIRPRPVIGSEGLEASAWYNAAERYGAPQVNHRFERDAKHPMTDLDWSAWVAVKASVEAIVRENAANAHDILAALSAGTISIEMTKGIPGSFRTWDHQLRQPIMLHSHDAVIDMAPLEGFLHQNSVLDTLGLSQQDVSCKSK